MSTGNVSLHLMCRSDDSITVIVDRREITGSSVFYLTRVDPESIYFLVGWRGSLNRDDI